MFVKAHHKIKGFTDFVDSINIKNGEIYLVSDIVNIESEWRAFVFNNELVGLQNYLGNFTLFPEVELIKFMMEEYTDCPPAHTLDVGINKVDGMFLIEVHNFYSCGLYGFNDYGILPQMFIRSFNHLIKNRY